MTLKRLSIAIERTGCVLVTLICMAVHPTDAITADGQPFYHGKTIRLVAPSSPGGGRDLYSRLLARSIREYIPGNPTVIVQNMPGAGGDVGLAYLFHRAKPNGLTFGHGTTSMYRDQSLGFSKDYDLHKFEFIGALPESAYLMVIRGDHPIQTFDELFRTSKPVYWGAETAASAGTHYLLGQTLKLMGANLELVTGYRGTAARRSALLRKEIDVTLERLTTARPYLNDGRMRILLIMTHPEDVPSELRGNAPTWNEVADPKLGELSNFIVTTSDLDKTFLAPPGVPPERMETLRRAFDQAAKDPEMRKALAKIGATGTAIGGTELTEQVLPNVLQISKTTRETLKKWIGR